MHAAMKYSAPKSAPQCCSESTHYAGDSDYFITRGRRVRGGSMSRAHRKAGVHDDTIIAFLLFCLEIYQAEQQRRRKLH
jgi:hypothetical protein